MANFDVRTVRLSSVIPHPNADRLELALVAGYQIVVAKGAHRTGDLVAYLPEGSVLPAALIDQMGLSGRLAGAERNRVKAVRLRGELSQGLVATSRPHWSEGESVMGELGVTKYDPPVPEAMAGEVYMLADDETVSFDLENIKAHPDVLAPGEEVVFTEKLHGTFLMAGSRPALSADLTNVGHLDGRSFVSSKGRMQKRQGLKHNEANAHNIYVRAAARFNLHDATKVLSDEHGVPAFILGEVLGVQDLTYGLLRGDSMFFAFAIVVGQRFLDEDNLVAALNRFGIVRAPVLYRGPFSQQVLDNHTSGKETLTGKQVHIREGVVVTPVIERLDHRLSPPRVALKSVSPDYLLRKSPDATEFN